MVAVLAVLLVAIVLFSGWGSLLGTIIGSFLGIGLGIGLCRFAVYLDRRTDR
jgi:hypothetical protein